MKRNCVSGMLILMLLCQNVLGCGGGLPKEAQAEDQQEERQQAGDVQDEASADEPAESVGEAHQKLDPITIAGIIAAIVAATFTGVKVVVDTGRVKLPPPGSPDPFWPNGPPWRHDGWALP
jgi:hypothetical protein